LLVIVNKVKLVGTTFTYSRIVERYEEWIITLENIKDLFKIIVIELLNALQAQEQWRLMRQDRFVEGALPTKH
jgi:hypothetical protein